MQSINNSNKNFTEDEIDLRELFATIMKGKKYIIGFAAFVTTLSLIYVSVIPKIYEIKALVEIGNIVGTNTNTNTNTIVAKLNNIYLDKQQANASTIKSVEVIKNTSDLILIVAESDKPNEAIADAKELVNYIEKQTLENNKQQLSTLTTKKKLLEDQEQSLSNQIKSITTEKNVSPLLVQSLMVAQSQVTESLFATTQAIQSSKLGGLVGDISVSKDPIKPKKALIVTVAFVTSLVLGIFGVFFAEFLKSKPKED